MKLQVGDESFVADVILKRPFQGRDVADRIGSSGLRRRAFLPGKSFGSPYRSIWVVKRTSRCLRPFNWFKMSSRIVL